VNPLTLTIIACLMSAPADCQEVVVERPPGMPIEICRRTGITIMQNWMRLNGEGRFVKAWRCGRGDGA
jgi:hypothetical protein